MPEPLAANEVESALAELPRWEHAEGALKKTFLFGSFREAVSFLVRVGFAAEQANHHPEIYNVYNRVVLTLSTHDAGNQVTANDTALAAAIEEFSWV